MTQHHWTEYEDIVLKKLKDEYKIQKWTQIAQKMAYQYNINGLNSKNCKQRYQSFIDVNGQLCDWDYDQQQKLFNLHSQLGNKWAIIGQQLMNKSDNEVKNHLYSKLRKSLRKVNKIIKQNFKKEFKEIKQNLIYKIIQGAEDKFKITPLLDAEVSQYCTQLKMRLINFSYDNIEINPLHDLKKYINHVRHFIEELIQFTKDYKRKPKKVRRASGQDIDMQVIEDNNLLNIPTQQNRMKSTGNSIYNSEFSQQESEQMIEFNEMPLKMPNFMLGTQKERKQSVSSCKQKIENIILQPPPNLNAMYDMQQQKYEGTNIYGGYSSFAESRSQSPQHIKKNDDLMWNSGGNSNNIWKNRSIEMVDQNMGAVEQQLKRAGLLQDQGEFFNPILKLRCSKKSSFSNFQIQEQQQHMFMDDGYPRIQMTAVEGKKFWILDSSIERSDKLFKSHDKQIAFGMFSSVDSKQSQQMCQSIGPQ